MLNGRWSDMLIGGGIVLLLILVPLFMCLIQNCQRRIRVRKRRLAAAAHLAVHGGTAPASLFFIDPHRRAGPASQLTRENSAGVGQGERRYLNYAHLPPTYEELLSQGVLAVPQQSALGDVGGEGSGKPMQTRYSPEGYELARKPSVIIMGDDAAFDAAFVRGEETRVSLPSYETYIRKARLHGRSHGIGEGSGESSSGGESPGTSTSSLRESSASPEPRATSPEGSSSPGNESEESVMAPISVTITSETGESVTKINYL